MPGHPPIYGGLYVDDFIYFSASKLVETEFERRIKEDQNMLVDFEGDLKMFLGMKWQQIADDESLTIHLPKEATIRAIVEKIGLVDANSVPTPYRSGCPVDNIPSADHLPPSILQASQEQLQSFVGSLNWPACGTHIDISTITNMLARHLYSAKPSHVAAARYVMKYLKGYKSVVIAFTTQ